MNKTIYVPIALKERFLKDRWLPSGVKVKNSGVQKIVWVKPQ